MRRRESETHQDRPPRADRRTETSRRRFLRSVGAGAAAGVGYAGGAHAQATSVVSMGNNYFDPIGLYVQPGTTVRFEIEAGAHSATAYPDRIPSDAVPFDSETIADGGFDHTFDAPGTYDYYCTPHRATGMVGRIVVGAPGGPAEASQIPDGAVPESETIVERGAVPIEAFDGTGGAAVGGTMGPMMGGGSGMMNGRGPGWLVLAPFGVLAALLGSVGGVVYWASRRGHASATRDDAAMAALRGRYARGEIDGEEYAERERRLRQGGQHDE